MDLRDKAYEINEYFLKGALNEYACAKSLWNDLCDLNKNLGWELTYKNGNPIEEYEMELILSYYNS